MKADSTGGRFFEQINRLHRLVCAQDMVLRLNPGELMMLIQVEYFLEKHPESPGVKPSELTMDGYISKPAVSKMIGTLEEKGFLVRTVSSQDRRVVYINLTETGRKNLEAERRYRDEAVSQIAERMGGENMEQLLELTERFILCAEEVFRRR
ncbi:MAG: MarR family transcriptional regulator [Lachnospiraceae bacterium]|nr:MarR family transcriptional regulator [Lachnospiraceae bacterium]